MRLAATGSSLLPYCRATASTVGAVSNIPPSGGLEHEVNYDLHVCGVMDTLFGQVSYYANSTHAVEYLLWSQIGLRCRG